MNDRDSLDKSLRGIYDIFAVTTFMDKGPEGEIIRGKNIADAAKSAHINQFIFSSVVSSDRKTNIPHFESKWEIEQHIKDIEIPATIFRSVFFMYNFDYTDTEKSIFEGTLRMGLKADKPL